MIRLLPLLCWLYLITFKMVSDFIRSWRLSAWHWRVFPNALGYAPFLSPLFYTWQRFQLHPVYDFQVHPGPRSHHEAPTRSVCDDTLKNQRFSCSVVLWLHCLHVLMFFFRFQCQHRLCQRISWIHWDLWLDSGGSAPMLVQLALCRRLKGLSWKNLVWRSSHVEKVTLTLTGM